MKNLKLMLVFFLVVISFVAHADYLNYKFNYTSSDGTPAMIKETYWFNFNRPIVINPQYLVSPSNLTANQDEARKGVSSFLLTLPSYRESDTIYFSSIICTLYNDIISSTNGKYYLSCGFNSDEMKDKNTEAVMNYFKNSRNVGNVGSITIFDTYGISVRNTQTISDLSQSANEAFDKGFILRGNTTNPQISFKITQGIMVYWLSILVNDKRSEPILVSELKSSLYPTFSCVNDPKTINDCVKTSGGISGIKKK